MLDFEKKNLSKIKFKNLKEKKGLTAASDPGRLIPDASAQVGGCLGPCMKGHGAAWLLWEMIYHTKTAIMTNFRYSNLYFLFVFHFILCSVFHVIHVVLSMSYDDVFILHVRSFMLFLYMHVRSILCYFYVWVNPHDYISIKSIS